MSTSKNLNAICSIIMVFVILITVCFMNAHAFGIKSFIRTLGYEDKIFDPSVVHTIDITMDDWDDFIQNATSEEYYDCDIAIDDELYKNIAIRGKGNTSLSSVENMDSERFSFKVEFDHFDNTTSYHGLDKLCLNNLIQDKTYMKDFVAYQMMNAFGVVSPLCSFAFITVNGEDWGLYLAVESVEDSFLQRNYGSETGDLYKPDSMSFGGGKGLGREFSMTDFLNKVNGNSDEDSDDSGEKTDNNTITIPESNTETDAKETASQNTGDNSQGFPGAFGGIGGGPGGMGNDDVKLKYIDDDPDSYSNIFDSAKTDVSNSDKNRLISSLKSLSDYKDLENILDIDEVLRYFVVHNFVVNGDSYSGTMIHNYYLYESDGKLEMIPWDYNLAYGTFSGNDSSGAVNLPIDTPIVSGMGFGRQNNGFTPGDDFFAQESNMDDRPMLGWIFSSDEYTQMYHEYFEKFVEEILDSGYATELISNTAEMIAPYVERDTTAFYSYEDFEKGYPELEKFIELRTDSVKGQLNGTIPSTKEGQEDDSAALIDTSSMDMDLLGGMADTNQFGGSGMPAPPDFSNMQGPPDFSNMQTPPDFGNSNSSQEVNDGQTTLDFANLPAQGSDNNTGSTEEGSNMPMPPGFDNMQAAPTITPEDYIFTGISAAALIAGLIFAAAYKRRGKAILPFRP